MEEGGGGGGEFVNPSTSIRKYSCLDPNLLHLDCSITSLVKKQPNLPIKVGNTQGPNDSHKPTPHPEPTDIL